MEIRSFYVYLNIIFSNTQCFSYEKSTKFSSQKTSRISLEIREIFLMRSYGFLLCQGIGHQAVIHFIRQVTTVEKLVVFRNGFLQIILRIFRVQQVSQPQHA